jgi:hypothetical protein
VIFIIIFGIIEQLVHFIMAMSFAIAFFSMFVATLFGFFIRTEAIAWGAFNLILELFVQSIIVSLLMSLVLDFVMMGAQTANAILLLGASLVGLWMSWNLLQSAIRGLTNSSQRLYQSFASSTGGNIASVSETNKSAVQAALSASTGASVLAGGGSFLQALGGTLGDSRTAQTMNYASRMLGGEDTLLGRAAESLGEGASARSLAGPVGGYLLGRQNRQQNQEVRQREARMADVGGADVAREEALVAYRQSDEVTDLQTAFNPQDARRVQALSDAYSEDDFDSVRDAVRRVRNVSPGISPQSPTFIGRVRDQLPPPLSEMEAPALEAFAELFGQAGDASPYEQALRANTSNMARGEADIARDEALSAYQQGDSNALQDAFSLDDAHRLAQLIDAYDDDDVAGIIYAVRASRDANPDTEPTSYNALRATRQQLPSRLAQMPTRDLTAFAQLFGASATQPALREPDVVLGSEDERRDSAVQIYMDTGNADALDETFGRSEANDVAILANEYARADFDAIVQAILRARTEQPDLERGSPMALRATRRYLPPQLRQMPRNDLAAFSRNFGTDPEPASISDRAGSGISRRRRAQNRAQNRAEQRRQQTDETAPSILLGSGLLTQRANADPSPPALPSMPLLAQLPQNTSNSQEIADFSATSGSMNADTRGNILASSAQEPPPPPTSDAISSSAVSSSAVARTLQDWDSDRPRTDIYDAPDIPPAFATPQEHALGLDMPTATPLVGITGMRKRQQQRLHDMGIDSMEKLADTTPDFIARTAKVDAERAELWRDTARTVLQAQQARLDNVRQLSPDNNTNEVSDDNPTA